MKVGILFFVMTIFFTGCTSFKSKVQKEELKYENKSVEVIAEEFAMFVNAEEPIKKIEIGDDNDLGIIIKSVKANSAKDVVELNIDVGFTKYSDIKAVNLAKSRMESKRMQLIQQKKLCENVEGRAALNKGVTFKLISVLDDGQTKKIIIRPEDCKKFDKEIKNDEYAYMTAEEIAEDFVSKSKSKFYKKEVLDINENFEMFYQSGSIKNENKYIRLRIIYTLLNKKNKALITNKEIIKKFEAHYNSYQTRSNFEEDHCNLFNKLLEKGVVIIQELELGNSGHITAIETTIEECKELYKI